MTCEVPVLPAICTSGRAKAERTAVPPFSLTTAIMPAGQHGAAGRNACCRHGELQRSRRYIALANPATDGLAGIPGLAKSCALPGGVGDDPLLLLHQVQVV